MTEAPSVRIEETKEGSLLEVRLKPRSSRAGVAGVREGALELRVSAPPVDGKANAAAVELLSDLLNVARSRILLRRGGKSRTKIFLVEGDSPSDLRQRLARILKKP